MSKHITKTEIKAYMARWVISNKKELELLQQTPPSTKLLQFLSLTASAHLFGAYSTNKKEDKAVRRRWLTIRRKMKHV